MSVKYDYRKEFQTAILNCIIKDITFVKKYRDVLVPEYFNDECYIQVCRVVLDLYDKHEETPSVEVIDQELSRSENSNYLREALNFVLATDIPSKKAIEDEAISFARSRAIERGIVEAQELLLTSDFEKAKHILDKAFYVGTNQSLGYNYGDENTLVTRFEEYGEEEYSIPLGLRRLDEAFEGGTHRKEQGLFIAPPSGGKTTFLIHVGKSALLTGHNVVHYTLELRDKRVARRYDMAIAEMTRDEIMGMRLSAAKKIAEKIKGKLIIQEYPASSVTCQTLKNHLHRIQDEGTRIDLVIVDYDDLINPTKYHNSETIQNVKSVYKEMRSIAFEFNCAVWTATQTNKKVFEMREGEVITGKEAAGSLEAKFGTPDVIITGNQTMDEYRQGIMRMHVAKNREGIARITEPYRITYDKMLIQEVGC